MALRVVLVDDDARFRALARRSLEADGIDVVAEAENGADALTGMPEWRPDVALVDIGLPDMEGPEVARRLAADSDVPVVILISTRDVDYGRRLATGVAAGYLPKAKLSLAAILEVTGPSALSAG